MMSVIGFLTLISAWGNSSSTSACESGNRERRISCCKRAFVSSSSWISSDAVKASRSTLRDRAWSIPVSAWATFISEKARIGGSKPRDAASAVSSSCKASFCSSLTLGTVLEGSVAATLRTAAFGLSPFWLLAGGCCASAKVAANNVTTYTRRMRLRIMLDLQWAETWGPQNCNPEPMVYF